MAGLLDPDSGTASALRTPTGNIFSELTSPRHPSWFQPTKPVCLCRRHCGRIGHVSMSGPLAQHRQCIEPKSIPKSIRQLRHHQEYFQPNRDITPRLAQVQRPCRQTLLSICPPGIHARRFDSQLSKSSNVPSLHLPAFFKRPMSENPNFRRRAEFQSRPSFGPRFRGPPPLPPFVSAARCAPKVPGPRPQSSRRCINMAFLPPTRRHQRAHPAAETWKFTPVGTQKIRLLRIYGEPERLGRGGRILSTISR